MSCWTRDGEAERRGAPRAATFRWPVPAIRLSAADPRDTLDSRRMALIDLSATGLRIQADRRLGVGEEWLILLPTIPAGGRRRVIGRVVWVSFRQAARGGYSAGLQVVTGNAASDR